MALPELVVFGGEGGDGVLAAEVEEEERCPEGLDAVGALEGLWVVALGHARLGEVPERVDGDGVREQVGQP